MKAYKIIHKSYDHHGLRRTMHSLRFAKTEEDAIKQLQIKNEDIIDIEFLGYKKGTAPKHLY